MHQLFTFVAHHWELCLGFIIVLLLLILFEAHTRLTGMPQISPQQATLLINRQDAIVLDLRDNNSFIKGHVINAINIPATEIEPKSKQLEKYKETAIIIVLTVGQTSSKIYKQLQSKGFNKLYNLKGGIPAWQNAGLPVMKK